MSDQEAALDQLLDLPVLDNLDEAQFESFITDVAQKIHTPESIAERYGFTSPASMLAFLSRNQELLKRIKQRRAIWESDGNVAGRLRELAAHTLIESLQGHAKVMLDTDTPKATRLDYLKAFARMAGVDGQPGEKATTVGSAGGGLNVVFNFSDGKSQSVTIAGTATDAA